jgi:hypothetical protein
MRGRGSGLRVTLWHSPFNSRDGTSQESKDPNRIASISEPWALNPGPCSLLLAVSCPLFVR